MRTVFVAIAVAVSALSLSVAGPASADSNDQQYLQVLDANGLGCGQGAFDCTQGDADMVRIGHSICRQMHGGNSKLSIAQQIMRSKPDIQPAQATLLVSAAAAAYCP